MPKTYYDSELTAEQIEDALTAIDGVVNPGNNGKVLYIEDGKIKAASASRWSGGYPEPTGTINISANGLVNVKDYAEANVQVPGGGEIEVIPLSVTANDTYTAPAGKAYSPVTVNVSGGGDILTGSDVPSASLGSDGDIYKQIFPIPNNVNFVEYLESSGTQYIDTGIIMDALTDIKADLVHTGVTTWIAGYRSTTDIGTSANALVISQGTNSTAYVVKAWGNANWSSSFAVAGPNIKAITKTKQENSAKISIIEKLEGASERASAVVQSQNTHTPGTIILFGIRSVSTITKASKGRIKRITFYENAVPSQDYLSCIDGNGVACMWDNIAGEYVYNDGTGDFAHGNAVTPAALDPVYYVKKNGAWEVIQQ